MRDVVKSRTKTAGHVAWLAASWLGLGASACKQDEPPPPAPVAPPPAPKPVDHVAADELLESTTLAFGLPLPRGFITQTKLSSSLIGEVTAPPEYVANYVRARVGDGKITMGSTSTTFSHVRPRAAPNRTLDVRVEKVKNGSRLEIVEVVVIAPELLPKTQPEALKKAGLGPNGRPDPQMQ